jgi:hypothetical protein
MSWVIAYCALVLGSLAGCLIQDQLAARHHPEHPERGCLEVHNGNSLHHK